MNLVVRIHCLRKITHPFPLPLSKRGNGLLLKIFLSQKQFDRATNIYMRNSVTEKIKEAYCFPSYQKGTSRMDAFGKRGVLNRQ